MKNRNELFVVIATVGVLACMVFSVLGIGTGCSDNSSAGGEGGGSGRAKGIDGKAQQAKCEENLHQIGLAASQYAMSYNDWFPTSSATIKPVWRNGDSGESFELLRAGEFLSAPEGYVCPSKGGIAAAKPGESVKGHVSYNWCDGCMDGNSKYSPIACDGTDNHKNTGRYLLGDGSVQVVNASGDKTWSQNTAFVNRCYGKTYTDYSF